MRQEHWRQPPDQHEPRSGSSARTASARHRRSRSVPALPSSP
uniref:Uncharacterized protein n=1 Tax=Arundo donax TaxID=35708 RepID=A0A0A9BK66_ARUDO